MSKDEDDLRKIHKKKGNSRASTERGIRDLRKVGGNMAGRLVKREGRTSRKKKK